MNRLDATNRFGRFAARGTASAIVAACALAWGCDDPNNNPGPTTPAPSGTTTTTPPGTTTPSGEAATTSPEARILSILHMKNQEEIDAGKLAKDRGSTPALKSYGEMLIADHEAADDKVEATAKAANVELMDDDDVRAMMAREKGMANPPEDHLAGLRNLDGAAFDAAFARHMAAGHRELIQTVEAAQGKVTNPQVRGLLTELLATFRKHANQATTLGGGPMPAAPERNPTTPPSTPPSTPPGTTPPGQTPPPAPR